MWKQSKIQILNVKLLFGNIKTWHKEFNIFPINLIIELLQILPSEYKHLLYKDPENNLPNMDIHLGDPEKFVDDSKPNS